MTSAYRGKVQCGLTTSMVPLEKGFTQWRLDRKESFIAHGSIFGTKVRQSSVHVQTLAARRGAKTFSSISHLTGLFASAAIHRLCSMPPAAYQSCGGTSWPVIAI